MSHGIKAIVWTLKESLFPIKTLKQSYKWHKAASSVLKRTPGRGKGVQKWMRRFGQTGLLSHVRLAECYLLQSVLAVQIFVLFLKQRNVDLMRINRKECRKLLMWKIFTSCQDNIFYQGVTLQGCMRMMFCCYSWRKWDWWKFCVWKPVEVDFKERNVHETWMQQRYSTGIFQLPGIWHVCCKHLCFQICIDGDELIQNRRILINRYYLQSELSKEVKKGRSYSKQRKLTSLIIHYEWPYSSASEGGKIRIKCYWYTWNCSLQVYASCFWNHHRGSFMAMTLPEVVWFSLQVKLNGVRWEGLDLINELVYGLLPSVAVLPCQLRNTKNFGQDELVKVMQQLW